MHNLLNPWLLLIPCLTLAFGVHGGELVTGINRQVRNFICALPFLIVSLVLFSVLPSPLWYSLSSLSFVMAYIGTDMGFDKHPLWLKGLITFPPFGAALLPAAYRIGKTPVQQEYLSGLFYGVSLWGLVTYG